MGVRPSLRVGVVLLVCAWLYPAPTLADPVMLKASPWGVTFADVEKSPNTTYDDYFCWAASASNMLSYGGWGNPTAADWVFFGFNWWTPGPSQTSFALDWWFSGRAPEISTAMPIGATGPWPTGSSGFWPGVSLSSVMATKSWWGETDKSLAANVIMDSIDAGRVVSIGIYTQQLGHAVTVWGYDTDGNGTLTALYVSDSDNDKADAGAPDTIQRYAVRFEEVNGWKLWYLESFYGSDSWWIESVTALSPLDRELHLLASQSASASLAYDRLIAPTGYASLDEPMVGGVSQVSLREAILAELTAGQGGYTPYTWQTSDLAMPPMTPDPSSPVPEPASLLLLGTGVVGVVRTARRRMRK